MRVAFLGLRGFPNIQGGVETHVEHLCRRFVDLGISVEVIARAPYHPAELTDWNGIKFKRIWCPRSKGLEAIVHTFLGTLYAGLVSRPDILHIQAIGPALMTPLARMLGLRVVVTHHGPDYDRQKWGGFAKMVLKLGERFGMRWSNARIVISKVIADVTIKKHHRDCTLIPNGVVLPKLPTATETLDKFGIEHRRYVLLVSRLVPEKRHFDLIEAFKKANPVDWKLVIVGASDHPDAYVSKILEQARASLGRIVCTGMQTGDALRQLYGHAGCFVLPSSHEGLPIALLEALSFGLPVIASDIPANIEVGLPDQCYFPLGDTDVLGRKITDAALTTRNQSDREAQRVWVAQRYDWNSIALQTYHVYQYVINQKRVPSPRVKP